MEDLEKIKDEEKETQFEDVETRTTAEPKKEEDSKDDEALIGSNGEQVSGEESKAAKEQFEKEDLENSLNESKEEPEKAEDQIEEKSEIEESEAQEPAQEKGVAGEEPDADQTTEEQFNEPKEEMFTQSQVNEMVGRARKEGRESALKSLFERYGVGTEDEMNEVFGKGQIYADLNDEFEMGQNALREAKSENALLKSGINPERWEDVKAILGAKGLEISVENIAQMLPTHAEWKGSVEVKEALDEDKLRDIAMGKDSVETTKPTPIVAKLGADPSPKPELTDQELAENIFGYKFNR